jgi:hypothetical protein
MEYFGSSFKIISSLLRQALHHAIASVAVAVPKVRTPVPTVNSGNPGPASRKVAVSRKPARPQLGQSDWEEF